MAKVAKVAQVAKIAFVDVDMTLVDNHTSQYNQALLHSIEKGQFEQVYLITDRTPTYFWKHSLHSGHIPAHWQNQLLTNICNHLQERGIPVVGISTLYDHYLHREPGQPRLTKSHLSLEDIDVSHEDNDNENGTGLFQIERAGDAAATFYMSFENKMAHYPDAVIDKTLLDHVFTELTGGDRYVYVADPFDLEPNAYLKDALPTFLQDSGDTKKVGQLHFLMERVEKENTSPLEIHVFNNKQQEVEHMRAVLETHERVAAVHTYCIKEEIQDHHAAKDDADEPEMSASEAALLATRKNGFLSLLIPLRTKQKNDLCGYPVANIAALKLLVALTTAANEFYEHPPTRASLDMFQGRCERAITDARPILGEHRRIFGALFAGIKHFFVMLKKTLCKEDTAGMRFFDCRTDSAKILSRLHVDANQQQAALRTMVC